MTRILIISGRGYFEDPWHDHAATSHALASALIELSPSPEIDIQSTFPLALEVGPIPDLLVLNFSRQRRGYLAAALEEPGDDWLATANWIVNYARAGGSVLAVHQTALAWENASALAEVVGGRWIEGVTHHPPIGDATLYLSDTSHAITSGLHAVRAFDERYCALEQLPGNTVLGWVCDDDGHRHAALWVRQTPGPTGGFSVYSAFGHDTRSYRSAEHRALLRNSASWLIGVSKAQGLNRLEPNWLSGRGAPVCSR